MLQARTIGGMNQQNNTPNIETSEQADMQDILNLGMTGLMFHFDMYETLETIGCVKYACIHKERLKHEMIEYSEMVSSILKDAQMVYKVQDIKRYGQREMESLRGYKPRDAIKPAFDLWYEWETYLSGRLTDEITKARDSESYYRESRFKKWLFDVRREIVEIVDMRREIEDM